MAIFDSEKQLNKILKEMKVDYKEQKGDRYPDDTGYCDATSFLDEDTQEILNDELTPLYSSNIFNDLVSFYTDNSQYQIQEHNEPNKATSYYALASAYGYLVISVYVIQFSCKDAEGGSLLQDTFYQMISSSILSGWEEEYKQMNEWAIESINYGRSYDDDGFLDAKFMVAGSDFCTPSWFLLDLYCKAYNREYNKSNAEYPEDMTPYNKVLEKWDTTDTQEVDQLVYLLSEYHLAQTEQNETDEDYFAFSNPDYWLYPYEILVWLAVREKQGLENPKKYSHPLMNTSVAEFFLNLKTPLEKPKDLPYAKVLLNKLKDKCPNTEIPEWL